MASREDQEYSSQAPAPYIGQFLQQGIFPYAKQFLDQQFQNYGEADSSPFTYTGQRVAEFDPREQYGMQLADSAIGSYRPYLGQQSGLLNKAAQATQQGLTSGRTLAGSAEQTGRGSIKSFDPNSAQSFYNPYEQDVVNQTMKDVREGLALSDMGLRDEAVSSGAFGGSRSRMRRGELAADTARGAAEQIGAIRNQGFTQAQERSQSAFEAQQARQAGLASLQAGLAGQVAGMGGQAGTGLSNVGSQYGTMANALPALQQQDIASQMGIGGLGRGRNQSLMDLNYQNFTGQYNLPMQTLSNVGALTASLGPMAGGFGYAGGGSDIPAKFNPSGVMPASPDYSQMQNMSTAQPAGVPGLESGIASNGLPQMNQIASNALPQGIDPRAVAANPEGFARNLEGARQQEATMPGSTYLAQQQEPAIGPRNQVPFQSFTQTDYKAGTGPQYLRDGSLSQQNQMPTLNGPSIGNTFAGAKFNKMTDFGPGTNPPSQMPTLTTGFNQPQGLSPVNPMAPPQMNPMTPPQNSPSRLGNTFAGSAPAAPPPYMNPMAQQNQMGLASGGYLSPGNGNRRYTSGLGSLANRRY